MRKNNFISILMIVGFISIFSSNAICGIVDETIKQAGNKAEANTSNNTQANVVSVSIDDTSLTGSAHKTNKSSTLTPIQTAASIASGLIASGSTDESVVKATLVSYGYEETEAEIAYVKASTSNVLTDTPTTNTTDTISSVDTEALDSTPTMSAKDRVAQGVKPKAKFENGKYTVKINGTTVTRNVDKKDIDTVKEMLSEGYSVYQITAGFAENKYDSSQTAAIFKEAGVSSTDAYDALSSAAVKKADADAAKDSDKPRVKFANRLKQANTDEQKQDAIKTTVNELKAAGYDVQETLDVAVKDLKDNGMSAQGVKDFLIAKVADGKPKAKFRGTFFQRAVDAINNASGRTKNMTSYGQGEVSLATAMMNAGYTESEVTATLQSGTYRYTNDDTHMIVSAAAKMSSGNATADLKPTDTNNINKNTETDILKRNTQALPI